MKEYLKYIWKKYPVLTVFALLLNLSSMMIGIYSGFVKSESLILVFLLVVVTWGISISILLDSLKNNKDAGIIAVLALVINIYSVLWYYWRKRLLEPLSLNILQEEEIVSELEMTGSEISQFIQDTKENSIIIELRPAVIYKSINKSYSVNHTIWLQNLDLKLSQIDKVVELPTCPKDISKGNIEIDSAIQNTKFKLPLEKIGICKLSLYFRDGETFEISCKQISTLDKGKPKYLKEFTEA